jgi:hypothetical protein
MCRHQKELKGMSDFKLHKLKVKLALKLLDERVSALEEAFLDLIEYEYEEEDENEEEYEGEEGEESQDDEDEDEDEDEKYSCTRCRC